MLHSFQWPEGPQCVLIISLTPSVCEGELRYTFLINYFLHFSLAVYRNVIFCFVFDSYSCILSEFSCGRFSALSWNWCMNYKYFITNTHWIASDVWIISSSVPTYEEVGGSDRPPSFGTLWYDWGKKLLTLHHLVNTLINYMIHDRLNIGYSLSWHCLIHWMVFEKKVQLVNPFHALRYDEQFMGVRSIIKALVVLCILHCFISLKHLSLRPRLLWRMGLRLQLELVSSALEVHPFSRSIGKDQRYDYAVSTFANWWSWCTVLGGTFHFL